MYRDYYQYLMMPEYWELIWREQYVLLAKRYTGKLPDIKQYVYNSINYSFIKELKGKQLLKDLTKVC
jgi:hypothetical protein